jgi:hypothetical protein
MFFGNSSLFARVAPPFSLCLSPRSRPSGCLKLGSLLSTFDRELQAHRGKPRAMNTYEKTGRGSGPGCANPNARAISSHLESHSCTKTPSNSRRITLLRKNRGWGGCLFFEPYFSFLFIARAKTWLLGPAKPHNSGICPSLLRESSYAL